MKAGARHGDPLETPVVLESPVIAGLTRPHQAGPRTLDGLFEAQVAKTPDSIALVYEGAQVTYRALDSAAEALADELRGIITSAERVVAVYMDRSPEFVAAVLAILKARCTFLPLEPSHPAARVALMLEDAHPSVVIAHFHLADEIPKHRAKTVLVRRGLPLAVADGPSPRPSDVESRVAYLMYTSGSTGRPKAVAVEHESVVNHVRWRQRAFSLTESDCVLHKASPAFDVAIWELFWPLTAGARVAIAPPEADFASIRRIVAATRVSVMHFVPSLFRRFLDYAEPVTDLASLRLMFCGGEALTVDLQERFLALGLSAELHQTYGPTETTISVLCHRCTGSEVSAIPLGSPIDNVHVVVRREGTLEDGPLTGELLVGGACISRGYVGQPGLTAERFIPDNSPGFYGQRLYRTGDIVKYHEDGRLEFVGRADRQVKIRGVRIELAEIELALLRDPAVTEAAATVVAAPDGEARLVAYVVAADSCTIEPTKLRQSLARILPLASLPTAFIELEALPLTTTGKIDANALPAPHSAQAIDPHLSAPRNDVRRRLLQTLADVSEKTNDNPTSEARVSE